MSEPKWTSKINNSTRSFLITSLELSVILRERFWEKIRFFPRKNEPEPGKTLKNLVDASLRNDISGVKPQV